MAYLMQNIETSEYFTCDEQEWVRAIETAKENYWEPDGTTLDAFFNASEDCEDSDNILDFYMRLVTCYDDFKTWDGNYFEKRNQVVLHEDSIYLALSLKGTDADPELIDFLNKGSFRICSD